MVLELTDFKTLLIITALDSAALHLLARDVNFAGVA